MRFAATLGKGFVWLVKKGVEGITWILRHGKTIVWLITIMKTLKQKVCGWLSEHLFLTSYVVNVSTGIISIIISLL